MIVEIRIDAAHIHYLVRVCAETTPDIIAESIKN